MCPSLTFDVFFYIENCLQVIFETLPIHVNCLHPNTLDTMILCFHNIFLYIYYLSLHIDELHEYVTASVFYQF